MKARSSLTALAFLGVVGCGYVGPVLPPSPMLPMAITDLTVLERGDQIIISFTTPPRTTDNLPVEELSAVDLRMGPSSAPFEFEKWAASAKQYGLEPPPPNDPDNPVGIQLSKAIPAAPWIGRHLAVAVRTAVKKKDHYSSWSNRVILDVIAPLAPPVVKAASTARGVLLKWAPENSGLEYRIYRKSASDSAPTQLDVSQRPDYLDKTSQYDTPYEYTVVAQKGLTESLSSKSVSITTTDIFPPSVPAGITALAGPNSIELSWQRSPEPDLKGYFVYRSIDNEPFSKVGDLQNVPSFSDRNVEHGKTYRYEVSAIDQKNNLSDKSAPTTIKY